ncbi:hypothetical protein C8Q79DRAFT_1007224 [Trametes meyenii]|nr:hypothetical protein C8Q79DRAFT_1007224 [Trametes meyenii]
MTRLCSPLQHEAATVLYRAISIKPETNIIALRYTLLSLPHRAQQVRRLEVTFDTGLYDTALLCLPDLIKATTRVQHFGLFGDACRWLHSRHLCPLENTLSLRLPELRSFSTNLSPDRIPQVMLFIRAHSDIEILVLSDATTHAEGSLSDRPPLPSVHTLACLPSFFRRHEWSSGTLTHLRLYRYHLNDLRELSLAAGSGIVNLHLGSTTTTLGFDEPWTPGDIATAFPRLRLLHVQFKRPQPFLPTHPFDWRAERAAKRQQSSHLVSNFMVVWEYSREDDVALYVAAQWHEYLNKAAFDVLTKWTPYIHRIAFRHTIIPYVSVVLNEDHTQLVRTKNAYMPDDYWMSV